MFSAEKSIEGMLSIATATVKKFANNYKEDVVGDDLQLIEGSYSTSLIEKTQQHFGNLIFEQNIKIIADLPASAFVCVRNGGSDANAALGNSIHSWWPTYRFKKFPYYVIVAGLSTIKIFTYKGSGVAEYISEISLPEDEKNQNTYALLLSNDPNFERFKDVLPSSILLPQDVENEEKLDRILTNWTDLASMQYGDELSKLCKKNGGFIQPLNEAMGDTLNLDYYSVAIERLPPSLSASQLLEVFRVNMNELVDTAFSTFHPFDEAKWRTTFGVGDFVHIRMVPGDWYWAYQSNDEGSVIVSQAGEGYWIFTTIAISGDGFHPVSGNRKFGITIREAGGFEFYTTGVDRPTTGLDNALENAIFTGANGLWTSLIERMTNFINESGGAAKANAPFIVRPKWDSIAPVLQKR